MQWLSFLIHVQEVQLIEIYLALRKKTLAERNVKGDVQRSANLKRRENENQKEEKEKVEKGEKELEGLRPFINCIFITHT